MTDSRTKRTETARENTEETRSAEERRTRVKEKLYKAKAAGELTDDDEAMILEYALGVVTRRGDKPGG